MTAPPRAVVAPRKRRRWSFVVTALLLGAVLAVLLLEAGFRMFWQLPPGFAEFGQAGLYVASADGGVALLPGYRGTLQVGDAATTVEINQLGMRGPAIADKQPGEQRVLVAGDSLVFGYGVESAAALPARLEETLRELGVTATVGNGGVSSFGVSHAVAHMQALDAPFGTDAFVLCCFLGNDAMDEAAPARTVYAGQLLQAPMAQLVRTSWRARLAVRSRAALWLETWIYTNHRDWSPLAQWVPDAQEIARLAGMPPGDKSHAGLFLDVVDEKAAWADGAPPVIPRVLAALRTSLERAKKVAGERPLWFVILPTLWQIDESRRAVRLEQLGFDPAAFRRGLAQERLASVAKDLGIAVLDATPMLAAESDPAALYLVDGGHFSIEGNQLMGRWLAAELAPTLKPTPKAPR